MPNKCPVDQLGPIDVLAKSVESNAWRLKYGPTITSTAIAPMIQALTTAARLRLSFAQASTQRLRPTTCAPSAAAAALIGT